MADIASCVDIDHLELDMITNIYVSDDAYNPHMRFFYIASMYVDNPQLNTWGFHELEGRAMEAIANADIYIDELMEYSYDKI